MSNFPSVDKNVYSLARLIHSLNRELTLPETFSLGGRYFFEREGTFLSSAQGEVQIPPIVGVKDGNLVVIQLNREDLVYEDLPITKIQLTKILSCEVVVHSEAKATQSLSQTGLNKIDWPVVAPLWSHFLNATREFFLTRGFLEMTTPSLVQNPGMEPELEPFQTEWRNGKHRQKFFLPTSPELHLKKLMVKGFTDIFEIKTVFRNEELTDLHQPEFQMLEWYRGFANLQTIQEDLSHLIVHLQKTVFAHKTAADSHKINVGNEIKKYSVADLFKEQLNFILTPQTTHEELCLLTQRHGVVPSNGGVDAYDWNDLFHLLWVAKVEAHLPKDLFILCDYPPHQAALARLNEHGWADRFEMYWAGVEIANAFHELNDPVEQRARFARDQKKRIEYGRTPLQVDEEFLQALDKGLPPSGGIALGLDRLFMVMAGFKTLGATRAFPITTKI